VGCQHPVSHLVFISNALVIGFFSEEPIILHLLAE
jgi:hypothetical protein